MTENKYANRSSATRGAKRSGLTEGQYEVEQVFDDGGKSYWRWVAKTTIATPATRTPPVASTPGTDSPGTTHSVDDGCTHFYAPFRCDSFGQPKGSNVKASKSTVENPVKVVWAIAEEMKKANPATTRKQLVEAALAKGVAYYTARTQVQRYLKARASVGD